MASKFLDSTIAQILEDIISQISFEGESHSNIADILLSILNQTPYEEEPKSVIADLFLKLKAKIEDEPFVPDDKEYLSTIGEILVSILEETEYDREPQSRIAELLLELKAELESFIEITVSGSVVSFNTKVSKPAVGLIVDVDAWQEGSGDPAPDNERPIHGWSASTVTRTGKNLLDFNSLVFSNPSSMVLARETPRKWIDNSYCIGISHNNYANPAGVYEYEILTNGINVRGAAAYGVNIPLTLPPLSQITVSAESINNGKIEVAFYDADGNWLSSSSGNYQTKTFTVPNNAKWTVLVFTCVDNSFIGQFRNILVEFGSTATEYEPFVASDVYTIQLGNEIFGGKVNFTTGEMDVTHKKIALSNLSWDSYGTARFIFTLSGSDRSVDINTTSICSRYKPDPNNATGGTMTDLSFSIKGTYCVFKDSNYSSVDDFKNSLSGQYLCYEIATPFTVQLTPEQVQILKGNNTLFADTGDIKLTYLDKRS